MSSVEDLLSWKQTSKNFGLSFLSGISSISSLVFLDLFHMPSINYTLLQLQFAVAKLIVSSCNAETEFCCDGGEGEGGNFTSKNKIKQPNIFCMFHVYFTKIAIVIILTTTTLTKAKMGNTMLLMNMCTYTIDMQMGTK